jgi:2-isopropylmalate synthase
MQHFVTTDAPLALASYRLDRSEGQDTLEAEIVHGALRQTIQGGGQGAIEALVDAWQRGFGHRVNIVDYSEHAIGGGTDAEAVAYVQINVDGQRTAGAAFDRDTVSAAMRAVLSALNRAHSGRVAA